MKPKLILFFFIIFSLFFFSFSFAQETKTEKVSYELPYPGILPDHPLYSLKVIRDKVYIFFLRDPLKKAQFKLLMADKRMFMGIMLMDKDKKELAEQTISKASKYYEEAVIAYYKAKEEKRDINELRDKLIAASYKYQEIIVGYQKEASEKIKIGLQESLARILKYQKELIEKKLNL